MLRFLVRRLAQSAVVLWLLLTASFFATRLLPGGPTTLLANPEFLPPEVLANLNHALGLDRPLPAQYLAYLKSVTRGDLGWSYSLHQPVMRILGESLGPSLLLMTAAFLLASVAGTLWGIVAAVQGSTPLGRLLGGVPVLAVTLPSFWVGLLLIYAFAINWRLLPSGGMTAPDGSASPAEYLRHLLLPAFVLSLAFACSFALYTESSLTAVLAGDYMRTAKAKGLRRRTQLLRHALPNAAIPLITEAGLAIPHLLAGSVVVERIFAWPGIGRLTIESLYRRDYPVILGVVLLVGLVVIVANLLTDIVYRAVNPLVASLA